uniref:Uncharacterized protein n=1 Tax=Clastoptera arizonana TaxID=38151 RepID=A0A1B6CHQ5_9HEMI
MGHSWSRTTHSYCDKPDVILCGNKADLADKRQVSEERAKEVAAQYELVYMETSAENGQNISLAIETLLEIVMKRMEIGVDEAMALGKAKPDHFHLNESEENTYRLCSC